MARDIKNVALAGYGRIGTPIVDELVKHGFQVTILTRSATNLTNAPSEAQLKEVDYDSSQSLQEALKGQDALISTVAMSAILNQKRMIDAAVAAGVKHYIPAEYSMATRDPKAQWLPIYSTVVEIQNYLLTKSIDWTAVNCGAMIEFAFDYPFIQDFDNHGVTLWDGGNNPLSVSNCRVVAQAIAGLFKQPDRAENHCVQVHGATLTQRQALAIAEKYTQGISWTVQERDAEPAIQEAVSKMQGGAAGDDLLQAVMAMTSAATFGKGHFTAAYEKPDNDWLGVDMMRDGEVDEVIRRRIEDGAGSAFAKDGRRDEVEGMGDVVTGLVEKHNERA